MGQGGDNQEAIGASAGPRRSIATREGETRAAAAFEALRRDIIGGVLAPGSRLRIEHLSRSYGVGATPLREALQRLSSEGLVLASDNRGFAVTPLRLDEFADLTIARIAIEREALRLSIRNGDGEWEAGLVAAAWRLARQDEALREDADAAMDAWERANVAFHQATVSACGSSWLLRVRSQLSVQAERYRRASVYLRRVSRNLAAEHAAIAEAALDRDIDRACDLVERHFEATARFLEPELRQRDLA
ncbi:GntR family transcriptional regulator [Rubrimonas cliftonensis]|uniref:Transcriptional regulator, GntR family n=1 Tax=Rubrimonas cliftonensis TaxID=89524 RepID=A0A1H4CMQ8_9RHOB|nr:FCD domain-containing protein [Rubrimonas cliftonensis]SEA61735.1 transcriptional regulator, GntR family [Rubrimonas cliftonensis]